MNLDYHLKKSIEKRGPLFSDPESNCFRLFNGMGDGVDGLTVDLYGSYILLQLYHQQAYAMEDDILFHISRIAADLPVSIDGILLKDRTKMKGEHQDARRSSLVDGSIPPRGYAVYQNGVRAYVDLVEGQNTGIFLDMREIRAGLTQYYGGNDRMLNLFSYTALFSVHALKHGAGSSVNVDLSRAVLQKARDNYMLNGLSCDDRDFIYGDSLEWIRVFSKKGRRFSFVIFDPPTFSRNRKRTFSVRKNYPRSLMAIDAIMEEGYVLTSINSQSVGRDEYLSFHPEHWDLVFFKNESWDFCHVGNPYLKAGLWKRKKC